MKKNAGIIFIIIVALVLISVFLCVNDREYDGTSVRIENVTVLSLSGTWFEMGRQYGNLARKQLTDVFAFCTSMIETKEGNADRTSEIVARQVEQMPYTIREFFRGASETSGLTADQLYIVNAVERIAGLPQHCSMAAVWGDYAEKQMIVGRNYDYGDIFSRLHDDIMVTVFNPADGALSAAIVGYAGEIYMVNGMNEAGLFMTLNNGKASAPMSSSDERITGTTLLLDILFEADSFEFLDRYFNTMRCSSSYIINALDGQQARSYEWCPVGVKHGESYNRDGLLISTNHYCNPEWDMAEPTDETSFRSFTRRDNLIRLCEDSKGAIDADIMKQIITTRVSDGGAADKITVYQIVAVPADKVLWVKAADSERWAEVDLKNYWK